MKKYILSIVCCLLTANTIAQNNKIYYYGELGFGFGNFASAKAALNGIYKNYCFSVSYYSQSSMFNKLPSDVQFSGDMPYRIPRQHLNVTCLIAGRVMNTNNRKVRFLLKGGLSIGTFSNPIYSKVYIPNGGNSYYSNYANSSISNYYVYINTKSADGMIIDPTIEFPLRQFFGISLGFWGNINSVLPTYGGEFSLIFGKLRKRHRSAE